MLIMNALEEILVYPFADALSLFGYPMSCPEVPHHVGGTYFRYWQEKNIGRLKNIDNIISGLLPNQLDLGFYIQ